MPRKPPRDDEPIGTCKECESPIYKEDETVRTPDGRAHRECIELGSGGDAE
jgi:hypothetical protein